MLSYPAGVAKYASADWLEMFSSSRKDEQDDKAEAMATSAPIRMYFVFISF